jgi:hypothetical protein
MKTKQFPGSFSLLLFSAAVLLLAAGCATQGSNVRSYNADYGQNIACSPQYSIENVDDTHFKVHITQGSPAKGPDRVIYMKQAARAVADTEAKRRGWQSFDLNYSQDQDQGWMHVLVADVVRKNPVEALPAAGGNP